MPVEYVKLRKQDLDLLIDVFQTVIEFKFRCLARENWAQFESRYLGSVIESMSTNQFKVAHPTNGIIPWMIDNIMHSKLPVEGLPKRSWRPLHEYEQVQHCLAMLRAAARGQMSYNVWASKGTTYKSLFEDQQ